MSIRRRLWRLFRSQTMCPWDVRVEWGNLPPHKAWPCRLFLPDVPRNVCGRKTISGLIGTRDWLWVGPRTIRAFAKLTGAA